MIANTLAVLVGLWDGFAGVFYDHAQPMSRSYALGHSAGRLIGAIRLWPPWPRAATISVASGRGSAWSAEPFPPIVTRSVRFVPEMRLPTSAFRTIGCAPAPLAPSIPAEQVTGGPLHNPHELVVVRDP
jgi:hypothetical protein